MAVEAGLDAKRIQELDKQYVLHSWSVQDQITPLPIAGGEGRYFWDHEGNRYLDFASQLVNVSIGYQHPKVVAAIKEQAEKLTGIVPPQSIRAGLPPGIGRLAKPPARLTFGLHPVLMIGNPRLGVSLSGELADRGRVVIRDLNLDAE